MKIQISPSSIFSHFSLFLMSLSLPFASVFAEAPSLEGIWAMNCQKIPSDVGIEESLTSQETAQRQRLQLKEADAALEHWKALRQQYETPPALENDFHAP